MLIIYTNDSAGQTDPAGNTEAAFSTIISFGNNVYVKPITNAPTN